MMHEKVERPRQAATRHGRTEEQSMRIHYSEDAALAAIGMFAMIAATWALPFVGRWMGVC